MLGAAVIAGWLLDIGALKHIAPTMASVKPNTATCFVWLGAALALSVEPASTRKRRVTTVCAALALVFGALTLAEYISGSAFGIDELILREPPSAVRTPWPGRMSPLTAVGMTLIALALLTPDAAIRDRFRPAPVRASCAAMLNLVVLSGYLYGAESLYGITVDTQVALHTAVGLLALSVGALCARPERGFMALLASRSATGASARRVLPAIILVPLILGLLRLHGQRIGLCGTEVGLALFAVSVIASMGAFAWFVGAAQYRAELNLLESEESLATTLNSIAEGVIATDLDGRVTRMNPTADDLTGWSLAQAQGRRLSDIFNIVDEHSRAPAENPVERVLRDGRIVDLANHVLLVSKDGSERPIADSGAPIRDRAGKVRGVVLVFRDLTEYKRAEQAKIQYAAAAERAQQRQLRAEEALRQSEEQLRQAHKMEAVGLLAGGAAHDFNNLLTVVLSYSSLVMDSMRPSDPVRADIEQIKRAGERAADLTRQLLAFSRRQVLQPPHCRLERDHRAPEHHAAACDR